MMMMMMMMMLLPAVGKQMLVQLLLMMKLNGRTWMAWKAAGKRHTHEDFVLMQHV